MIPETRIRQRRRPKLDSAGDPLVETQPPLVEQTDGENRDFEVGYGKPPKATRFQPGKSGNPKGRPKGAKNLTTLIQRELDEGVVVREGGKRRKVAKRQVVAMQLVKKAVEGNDRAIAKLIDLDDQFEEAVKIAAANQNESMSHEPLGSDDYDILKAYEKMVIEKFLSGEASNHGSEGEEIAGGGHERG